MKKSKKNKILIVILVLIILVVVGFFILKRYVTITVKQLDRSEGTIIDYTNTNDGISKYEDENGDIAYIPQDFKVSSKEDEQTINTGLVVIGPDGSEFVWVPTTTTKFERHNFAPSGIWNGSYELSETKSYGAYYDETDSTEYINMKNSVEKYGGFYIGRYESSKSDVDSIPSVKKITTSDKGRIWVNISPQDIKIVCNNMYSDNETVQGFLTYGINFDTALQWLIDSGAKTEEDIRVDSTSWGNYSNNTFTGNVKSGTTGMFEEAKANNIYDLAGNYWEWTAERYGDSYVMRSGGYNIMGSACTGSSFPAANRDPLPGNNHHPNVSFRVSLYLK